jgi:hypothetical protein
MYDSCPKSGLTDRSTSPANPLAVGSASSSRLTIRCKFNRARHSSTRKPGWTRARSSSLHAPPLTPPPSYGLRLPRRSQGTSSPSCPWALDLRQRGLDLTPPPEAQLWTRRCGRCIARRTLLARPQSVSTCSPLGVDVRGQPGHLLRHLQRWHEG